MRKRVQRGSWLPQVTQLGLKPRPGCFQSPQQPTLKALLPSPAVAGRGASFLLFISLSGTRKAEMLQRSWCLQNLGWPACLFPPSLELASPQHAPPLPTALRGSNPSLPLWGGASLQYIRGRSLRLACPSPSPGSRPPPNTGLLASPIQTPCQVWGGQYQGSWYWGSKPSSASYSHS